MKAALKRFNRKLLPSWDVVRAVEDDNGSNELAQLFLLKPSRVHYPDYYEVCLVNHVVEGMRGERWVMVYDRCLLLRADH